MNITYTIIHVVKLLAGQVKSPTCQVANKSTCRQWSSTSNPIQQQHARLRVRSAMQRHKSAERPILCQISSLMYLKIQRRQVIMNVLHPGCARPPRWSPPVLWRRFEDGLLASAFSCNHPRRPTCPVRQTCTVKNSAIWLCCWPADHRCWQWLNYRTRSEASERARKAWGWRWQWRRGSGVWGGGVSSAMGEESGKGAPQKMFWFSSS